MEIFGNVRDILLNKGDTVWTTTMQSSVYDAIGLMGEKNIGALVVVDGDEVVGILSERDYSRKVVLVGRTSRDTLVGEIISRPAITVGSADSIETCMKLMTSRRIRHLPVVEHGVLDGTRLHGRSGQLGDAVAAPHDPAAAWIYLRRVSRVRIQPVVGGRAMHLHSACFGMRIGHARPRAPFPTMTQARTDGFNTTNWSLVLAAADIAPGRASDAMERLCSRYWFPVYAYVRRRGNEVHQAEDLTQGFFEYRHRASGLPARAAGPGTPPQFHPRLAQALPPQSSRPGVTP